MFWLAIGACLLAALVLPVVQHWALHRERPLVHHRTEKET